MTSKTLLSGILKERNERPRGGEVVPMQNPIRGKERDGSSAERGFEAPAAKIGKSLLIGESDGQGDSWPKGGWSLRKETDFPRPMEATFAQ